jgi:ABC-2 type transport system permease protein
MWLRQIKRYWRSKPRIIGSLAQPLLFLVALGFGFGPIFEKAGGGNYLEFLAPGIIAMTVLSSSLFNGIEIIWDRQFGFLKETLVSPVPRYKIILGRILGGATVATIQGIIVLLISLIIGFKPTSIFMIPLAIFFMFLISIFFAGVGTSIASKLEDMQGFQLIVNFIFMPLFFLSGALFPLSDLPSLLNQVVKLNPLTYGVDGLRLSLTNISHLNLISDFFVLFICSIIVVFIGAYLFSKTEV